MAITKSQKETIIAKVREALSGAVSVVFVRFNKVTAKDTYTLRKTLREEGISYFVAKKTLLKRALAEKGYTGELSDLPGEVAIAWTANDPTAPARNIYEFAKKNEGLTILGGVFENGFVDGAKMQAIGALPNIKVLRGMFVNIINSPIQRFVIALDQISAKKGA
jgi:large subunit ribosomal protein L10